MVTTVVGGVGGGERRYDDEHEAWLCVWLCGCVVCVCVAVWLCGLWPERIRAGTPSHARISDPLYLDAGKSGAYPQLIT